MSALVRLVRRFGADQSGAGAAEFALIVPLMLLLLFGIIEVGTYAWTINKSEKATQMGARMAVVTDPVATGLNLDYVGLTIGGQTLGQGDTIPLNSMLVTCNSTACSCSGCPAGMTVALATGSPSPFNRIVQRMQNFDSTITAANVEVLYRSSGLGYAGDPSGMDISPLITVRLKNRTYQAPFLFKTAIPLPSSSYSLTMEDASGSVSN
ncbi:MAG: pilus assembly protein [Sphingomonadales bacterium]|nr:pilus assembly protein [Sphingomonadales bacterium]